MPTQKLMQGEGNFVGMRCAPGNNALELYGIVGDGADFHRLGFNAHVRTWKSVRWAGPDRRIRSAGTRR
jgi:hypothetical protein